ncbi:MAG: pyruvate kinase [Elusimicrobiota bacterium]
MINSKTQILCTIGPSSADRIAELYEAGLSGIRINSSHGNLSQHEDIIKKTRVISDSIFVVYDIKGPKIRIGDLSAPVHLNSGMRITLKTGADKNSAGYPYADDPSREIPVTYDDMHLYVKPGERLLLDDGLIGLRIVSVNGRMIDCEVLYGAVLRSRKGINHPDTVIDFPYTVEDDVLLIKFGIENNVDYIADSFERNSEDVRELRARLDGTGIGIISKIENPEGVRAFDEILEATDAIMVARGDLGVELEPWKIPEIQKVFIEKCRAVSKPVIVATQMLESMIDDPRPKRSDVSDIANAIYDGAGILMLSGETSIGKYPILCVRMMQKIIETTETTGRYSDKNILPVHLNANKRI